MSEEIREICANIDHIDKSIIKCLSQRSQFTGNNISYKKFLSDINSSECIAAMLKDRRCWANKLNVDADFVELLFKYIIDFFRNSESLHGEKKKNKNGGIKVSQASVADAREILALQKRAFIQEAELINNYSIGPIIQTIEEMIEDFNTLVFLKAMKGIQIIGSARGEIINDVCYIGRVVVEPVYQKEGYGKLLMHAIEAMFSTAKEYELFTGEKSKGNIQFYSKLGYSIVETFVGQGGVSLVKMRKVNNSNIFPTERAY